MLLSCTLNNIHGRLGFFKHSVIWSPDYLKIRKQSLFSFPLFLCLVYSSVCPLYCYALIHCCASSESVSFSYLWDSRPQYNVRAFWSISWNNSGYVLSDTVDLAVTLWFSGHCFTDKFALRCNTSVTLCFVLARVEENKSTCSWKNANHLNYARSRIQCGK